jgi:hypothetical protein
LSRSARRFARGIPDRSICTSPIPDPPPRRPAQGLLVVDRTATLRP